MTGIADLAGALALALSIALWLARRIRIGAWVCAVQAVLAAMAMAAAGRLPVEIAIVAGALNGAALPFVIQGGGPAVLPAPARPALAWPAVFALLAATAAVFAKLGEPGHQAAFGAAVLLLGLGSFARAPAGAWRALGLLSAQNGIVLAAGGLPAVPLATAVAAAVPMIPMLVVGEKWVRQ